MKQFVFLMVFAFAAQSFAGGSIVGDGGYLVVCPKGATRTEVELLDLYEARHNGNPSQVDFGNNSLSVREKTLLGLERLEQLFEPHDLNAVRRAAFALGRFRYDPWSDSAIHSFDYLLQATTELSDHIAEAIKKDGCYLLPVIIRPRLTPAFRQAQKRLCERSFATIEDCFFTDERYYRMLSKDQKACLNIHESLRALPPPLALRSDSELRQLTARICTAR